jgi:Mrp family chromosome partitioning ATPase
MLDILVDLKSAKPYRRSLSRVSARLPVIGRQTVSPLASAPFLQRHYIREEAPLGDLSQSIYRVSTETLFYQSVRALEGSEARVPTASVTGGDQKATAAEETPLHFADRRHRIHRLYTD